MNRPRLAVLRALLGHVNADPAGRACVRQLTHRICIRPSNRRISSTSRNAAKVQMRPGPGERHSIVKFTSKEPLQPIYTTVPNDWGVFIADVNKAFGNQWAPRSAFEEIYQFYLDRDLKEKRRVKEMEKVMKPEFMTTYMLDAIEEGGIHFIKSLGEEWTPLAEILKDMSINERRSFYCKILYQRMKEMQLEELEKSAVRIKPFERETVPFTPEQQTKVDSEEHWEENLPKHVRDAYLAPRKLHAPYGVTVAQLQIRGYYLPPVDFMADFCVRAAYYFGLPCTGPVPLPRRIERWTVIKSPFIYKKQQENFERRTYSRLVTIKDGHPDVVEMWLSYCVRNQFHGTGMRANVFTHDYVGVGKTMNEDIKRLIDTERWGVDGYNMLQDDAQGLKTSIDREILRIESKLSQRDSTERAKRVLQSRVDELLKLQGLSQQEAQRAQLDEDKTTIPSELLSEEEQRIARDEALVEKYRKSTVSMVQGLPKLDIEDLEKEVAWDKQQDEALRKHLLHVGMYAQQKGIAPLTREEYFVYVPHVLLPKYKGIHKDLFALLAERDMLHIPAEDTGYLAEWDIMTERQRFDTVIEHRRRVPDPGAFRGNTSRLTQLLELRKGRLESSQTPESQAANPDSTPSNTAGSISEIPIIHEEINPRHTDQPENLVASGEVISGEEKHPDGGVSEMTGEIASNLSETSLEKEHVNSQIGGEKDEQGSDDPAASRSNPKP